MRILKITALYGIISGIDKKEQQEDVNMDSIKNSPILKYEKTAAKKPDGCRLLLSQDLSLSWA